MTRIVIIKDVVLRKKDSKIAKPHDMREEKDRLYSKSLDREMIRFPYDCLESSYGEASKPG